VTVAADASSWDVRRKLESLVERDLLGPWDGPEEELPAGTAPGERYLLGKLVPAPSDAPGQTLILQPTLRDVTFGVRCGA